MPKNEMSNSHIFKFISLEALVSLIIAIFLGGVAYSRLVSADDQQNRDIDSLRASVSAITIQNDATQNMVSNVKLDLVEVRTNQTHFKEKLESQDQKLEKILRVLTENSRL